MGSESRHEYAGTIVINQDGSGQIRHRGVERTGEIANK